MVLTGDQEEVVVGEDTEEAMKAMEEAKKAEEMEVAGETITEMEVVAGETVTTKMTALLNLDLVISTKSMVKI